MPQNVQKSQFQAKLLRPAKPGDGLPWAFVVLPVDISARLPRRGRITVEGTLNGHDFRATLEPDGQLGHWLPLSRELVCAAGAELGDSASFEMTPMEKEPDPELPVDLQEALAASPEALATWKQASPLARLDWIHWITSAKQARTRAKRILKACDLLAAGERNVCCFDSSGYYSRAFCAPRAADSEPTP